MNTLRSLYMASKRLGLKINFFGRSKAQVLTILRDALWHREHPVEPLPPQVLPQLASSVEDLPEGDQDEIWRSPSWAAAVKWDGVRCLLHASGGEGGTNRMTSRRLSTKTYRLHEFQSNFPHLRDLPLQSLKGTVFDGELYSDNHHVDTGSTVTGSPLQVVTALTVCSREKAEAIQAQAPITFIVFDLPFLQGRDLRSLPFAERRKHLESLFMRHSFGPHMRLEQLVFEDKRDFYDSVVNRGGEGVMLKDLNAPYSSGQRSLSWRKVKRHVTYDGFITGWKRGKPGAGFHNLVGALEISAYDSTGKPVVIANCSALPYDFRCEISVPDGKRGVFLKPDMMGRVVEVKGYELNKNGLLTHARIVRWRPEKPQDECTVPSVAVRIKAPQHSLRKSLLPLAVVPARSGKQEIPHAPPVEAGSAA